MLVRSDGGARGDTFLGGFRRVLSLRLGLRCFWQSWLRCRHLESEG